MKILIKIKEDRLEFINKKKLNTEYKNMLNTNVISNDELVFSDEYIKENTKIVSTFLNELIKTYHLTTLSFQNLEVASLFFPFLNRIKNVSIINFESDEVLPYKYCEKIFKCNEIKFVSAQFIPAYEFELLDKYGIIPESRNEILFTSNFMELNNLNTYSSIFYKYILYLEFPLSEEDLQDFTSFCKINQHLKKININVPNKINLEQIIYILKEYKHKNVKIIIHGDINDPELIDYLRKNNKIIKKKYKIFFKLKYSDNYLQDNMIKQANNNILRTCGIFMLLIAILSVVYICFDNYKSMLEVTKIQEELNTYIENSNTPLIYTEDGKEIKNNYIASLSSINSDIVAWLKVNGTSIDYAIVQSDNNNYYLDYNIYREKDPNGWLYMDYENDATEIDENIVIYGHNRYLNGVMFGTLNKVLYKSWYSNPDNLVISFDTIYGSYKYQVFSVYIVNTTNDYIKTNFKTLSEKKNFINTITTRSIHNFNIPVDENTKVLTLSTCNDESSRIVLHAALIKES